ncbi:translation initiation factor eIF-1A [Candidatus Marsarchaeota archaeon]|nr:translation initiation factor eIF-1A [Candidatus Marsarchaeota archaeon]MCL5404745.1 translation initiation factor eIF-1A [Candidatus Marsarchaeota archaeon]
MGRNDGRMHDSRRGAPVTHSTKLPSDGEVVGKVTKLVGATRFVVDCSDGNQRICIIPGRLRRMFWIKENDVVLVKPWIVQTNERGDIIWRYSLMDIGRLKEKGYIN